MTVKITDPKLPALVMDRIMRHPDFKEVAALVKRNTSGKIYLVGGKVYRTLIELIYGYDCGADKADWDFLCMGEVIERRRAYLLENWVVDRPAGTYKAHSMCLTHYDPVSANMSGYFPPMYSSGLSGSPATIITGPHRSPTKKIDIIGIKDIPKIDGTVNDYFKAVPLDIQMVALTTDNAYPALRGQAFQSIEAKTVSVNNEAGTLRPINIHDYAGRKAASLKFSYRGRYHRTTKTKCDCFDGDIISLWRTGCQRKDIHL